MRRTIAVLAMLVFLVVVSGTIASADVFGLGPTLTGGEKLTASPRAEKPFVPSNIAGLEAYSLFGDGAGATAAVTWKRTYGHWMVRNYDMDFRAGILGGVVEAGTNLDAIYGAFLELEAARIGGIVLVVRADGGKLRVNPGFKVNLVSVSF